MEPIRKVTETDIIDRFIGELEVDCEWQAICRRVGRAIRAGIRYWADGVYGHVLHTVIANLSTLFLITVYEVRSFNDWASWFSAVLP